eukprot:gene236-1112_t
MQRSRDMQGKSPCKCCDVAMRRAAAARRIARRQRSAAARIDKPRRAAAARARREAARGGKPR